MRSNTSLVLESKAMFSQVYETPQRAAGTSSLDVILTARCRKQSPCKGLSVSFFPLFRQLLTQLRKEKCSFSDCISPAQWFRQFLEV